MRDDSDAGEDAVQVDAGDHLDRAVVAPLERFEVGGLKGVTGVSPLPGAGVIHVSLEVRR